MIMLQELSMYERTVHEERKGERKIRREREM
jgi:hypothetical protein